MRGTHVYLFKNYCARLPEEPKKSLRGLGGDAVHAARGAQGRLPAIVAGDALEERLISSVNGVGLINFRVPSDVRSLVFGTRIALLTGVAKAIRERNAANA